jgi:acetylornithine deacetylase
VSLDVTDGIVDGRREGLIELVRELVATPSPSPPGDERAVAEILLTRLHDLGIADVQVVGGSAERPNVLARIGGGDGPTLVLNGHTDTKPPGDLGAWRTPPWDAAVHDGVLTGLGSADMKGAVAAIVYAGLAVAEAGTQGTLILCLSSDEEAGGEHGALWLAERGLVEADACVIAEPCGIRRDWEAIRLVSRGNAIFRVRVHGTQMHSSLSEELGGRNASAIMARLMTRMHEERRTLARFEPHPLVSHPTVNVGLTVAGGLGYGILPGEGDFLCDLRALPGMTREGIEADVRAFLERARAADPELDAELEWEHWIPPTEIPSDHPIVDALAHAAEGVLGERPPLSYFPGGTDAPHFQLVGGVPTVPSFGPGLLTVAHAPNESIRVESIVEAAKIYARAARRFLDG